MRTEDVVLIPKFLRAAFALKNRARRILFPKVKLRKEERREKFLQCLLMKSILGASTPPLVVQSLLTQ